MSHFNNYVHYDFFKNKELNSFYLSVAVITFGESLISIFVPIYLYILGYSIPVIIMFYFLVSLNFVIFSYFGARIVSKIGDKHSILFSAPFAILYYFGLLLLESNVIIFYLLPFLLAFRMIFYNYGYHLNFINHSKEKRRGKELALIGIITLIATATAPFLGGILATDHFSILFLLGAFLMMVGTLPLFLSKDKYEKINFSAKDLIRQITAKSERGNLISFSGYAMESIIGRTIWPIFLIIILQTTAKTGFIFSASMLISIFLFYFIGRITDKKNKIKLLKIGTAMYFFAWVGRIFANTSYKILFIDSYKNISEKVLHLPWSAHSYDLAIRKDRFSFLVSREIIFNLSRILFLPFIALIFWLDFNPFAISFFIAGLFSIGYAFIKK
ncbi:MFS transporter [Candidatus Parcubacteria bacterium]|nr:MFS transporter [Candidatus Parcubacteria bacterium]